MGKKDLYQSDFYDDERRFADLFNGTVFHGRQVMRKEELEETDGELINILQNGTGVKVIRDKVKKWHGKYFAIAVVENQSHVDYSMVFRVMKAEVMGYEKQRKKAFKKALEAGEKFDAHEYLSGMKRGWRFTPIITLVLYLGTDRSWDGAGSLQSLLKMDGELKELINDYKIHLYDYHEYQDYSVFETENRVLFEVLSGMGDKDRLKKAIHSHPDWYDKLDEESAKAISGITGAKIQLESIEEKNEEGQSVYNMCKALVDLQEEGRQEGQIRILYDLVNDKILTLSEAARRASLTEEDFMAKAELYRNI